MLSIGPRPDRGPIAGEVGDKDEEDFIFFARNPLKSPDSDE
jgi:hypothetical protein